MREERLIIEVIAFTLHTLLGFALHSLPIITCILALLQLLLSNDTQRADEHILISAGTANQLIMYDSKLHCDTCDHDHGKNHSSYARIYVSKRNQKRASESKQKQG
jgi:hypothetical protein